MYLVEIRGKLSRENENKEDILTSNVFSFFKYTDRQQFLYPFIRSLGIDIAPADAVTAEFQFWPRFEDKTEPDLVLITGNYYLLFESKYLSGFGQETPTTKHQLLREIIGGEDEAKAMGKEFRIIAITADYFIKPDIRKAIPDRFLPIFRWLNWQSIAWFLYQVLENSPELPNEARLFGEDLYQLFLKKNLRGYEGTKSLIDNRKISEQDGYIFLNASTANFRGDFIGFYKAFEQVKMDLEFPERVFFIAATARFRGDFIGFLESLSTFRLEPIPSTIYYKATPRGLILFQNRTEQILPPPNKLFFNRRSNGAQ